MLAHLDNLLRHLFISQVKLITAEDQVRFQPPDQDWRTAVVNLGMRNALNVYLSDLRENRRLRSNDHLREITDGIATDIPAPRRIDCHYLITAWSPASAVSGLEPTVDEHSLLYDVTAVLMRSEPLVPRMAYAPDPLPPGFPALIADSELPMTVLPVEGFPKYAEFWGTMGNVHPWKPAVYLVVTLPVALQEEVAGPLVTTRITEYRQAGLPATAEVWIQIAGTVLDTTTAPPAPVAAAQVRLETTTGEPLQRTNTDELGHFSFARLRAGSYQIRYSAAGFAEKVRALDVPSPSGEYDLRLA